MIFALLCLIVIIISHFTAKSGLSVTYFDAKAKEKVTKEAVSLLNWEGLAYIFNSATENFTSFEPLGTVLVAMLGVGVAEHSGLFNASLKRLLSNVNPTILTNITNEALKAGGIDLELAATCNWYFLFVSTFLITIIGTLVTNKIVEKNLGNYTGSYKADETPLTDLEKKGLNKALIALIIYAVIMALLMFPSNAPFRYLS